MILVCREKIVFEKWATTGYSAFVSSSLIEMQLNWDALLEIAIKFVLSNFLIFSISKNSLHNPFSLLRKLSALRKDLEFIYNRFYKTHFRLL